MPDTLTPDQIKNLGGGPTPAQLAANQPNSPGSVSSPTPTTPSTVTPYTPPSPTGSITSSTLTPPSNPVTLPTITPNPAIPSVQSLYDSVYTATPTAAEQQNTDLQARLKTLVGSEGNKSADQLAAEQANGVFGYKSTVTDLTSQLNSLNNEAKAQQISLQNQPILGSIVAGQQDAVERSRAVKALTISAGLTAAQNNLSLAQSYADRAVEVKYAPIENELKYFSDFLSANQNTLSREDKKKADLLQAQLTDRQNQLDIQKTATSRVYDIGIELSKNGADAKTISKVMSDTDPQQAINDSNGYLSYPFLVNLYQQGIIPNPPTLGAGNTSANPNVGSTPAMRNNNPGNLKDPKTGQFKVFASLQDGYDALKADLLGKVTGATSTPLTANSTLLDFAKIYAPSTDSNNPTQYAANLAAQLGVPVTTKIGTYKDNIGALADAVSKNEDINAYNTLKNPRQTTPSSTNTNKIQAVIDQVTPLLKPYVKGLTATGATYIDSSLPGYNPNIGRTESNRLNIPILNASQVQNAVTTDEAIRNITQVVAPAWAKIAPQNGFQRANNNILSPLSALGNTDFYSQNKTFQDNAESLAQQIKALSGSAPRLGLLSTAKNALPNNAGYGKPIGYGGVDTYKQGVDKMNRTLELLNQSLQSYLPNAQPAPLITGGSGSTSILKSPDGTQQVNISDLTPAQITEANNAGWK